MSSYLSGKWVPTYAGNEFLPIQEISSYLFRKWVPTYPENEFLSIYPGNEFLPIQEIISGFCGEVAKAHSLISPLSSENHNQWNQKLITDLLSMKIYTIGQLLMIDYKLICYSWIDQRLFRYFKWDQRFVSCLWIDQRLISCLRIDQRLISWQWVGPRLINCQCADPLIWCFR